VSLAGAVVLGAILIFVLHKQDKLYLPRMGKQSKNSHLKNNPHSNKQQRTYKNGDNNDKTELDSPKGRAGETELAVVTAHVVKADV